MPGEDVRTSVWQSQPVPALERFSVQPRSVSLFRAEQMINLPGDVHLETTGGTPIATSGRCDAITEIGAVKIRGGDVLAEFATLVDPGRDIPPQIVLEYAAAGHQIARRNEVRADAPGERCCDLAAIQVEPGIANEGIGVIDSRLSSAMSLSENGPT